MLINDCGNVFTRLKTDSNETNAQKQTRQLFNLLLLHHYSTSSLPSIVFVAFCFILFSSHALLDLIVSCAKCFINKVEPSFRSEGINAHIISSSDKNFMLAPSHFGAV